MISPIKITIKTLESVKMYVHDFPSSFPAKFFTNMGMKISAASKVLLFTKKDIVIGNKITLKIPLLLLYVPIKIKSGIDCTVKSFLKLFGNVDIHKGIKIESVPLVRYFIKNAEIESKINMSVKAKSLVYYKNYERNYLTIEEIFADPNINTNANYLYKEF